MFNVIWPKPAGITRGLIALDRKQAAWKRRASRFRGAEAAGTRSTSTST
jgi:hypothetical protein